MMVNIGGQAFSKLEIPCHTGMHDAAAPADFVKPPCQETKKVLYSRYAGIYGGTLVMPETIVENCPRQISKVKGGVILSLLHISEPTRH